VNAVLTKDGQIEIPRELREQLGFQPGNVLELQNQAGTLVAWKKVEPDNIHPEVAALTGLVPPDTDAETEYHRHLLDKHR
jgi:bifunctional DNA-binding transcriptional regulator/antitoxin component of YhaV-PrlF toxin-antitoxin module